MSAFLNTADVRLGDAIAFSQNGLLFAASPDSGNLPVRQFTIPMIGPVAMTALNACIGVVFGLRANAKMRWIDTRGIVASVHDNHAGRNGANEILVRVPMGANRNLPWQQENAVSVPIAGSLPKPALGGLFDAVFKYVLRPKYGVILKLSVRAGAVIAKTAKLAAYGVRCTANHAIQFSSNLVCHRGNLPCGAPIICYNHGVG